MAPQTKQYAPWAAVALTAVIAIVKGSMAIGSLETEVMALRRDIEDLKHGVYASASRTRLETDWHVPNSDIWKR